MSTNVGNLDRAVRVIAGLALLAWALGFLPGYAASPWGWIGIIPLLTGIAGNCPLYSVIGLSTCRRA